MLMLPTIAPFAADVEASAVAGTRQQRPLQHRHGKTQLPMTFKEA